MAIDPNFVITQDMIPSAADIPDFNPESDLTPNQRPKSYPQLRADTVYKVCIRDAKLTVKERAVYGRPKAGEDTGRLLWDRGSLEAVFDAYPVDETGATVIAAPKARLNCVLPVPNVAIDGHERPELYNCWTYTALLHAAMPDKFPALPKWDKESKLWTTADGETVSAEEGAAMREALQTKMANFAKTIVSDVTTLVGYTFFVKTKASVSGEKTYINVNPIVPTDDEEASCEYTNFVD